MCVLEINSDIIISPRPGCTGRAGRVPADVGLCGLFPAGDGLEREAGWSTVTSPVSRDTTAALWCRVESSRLSLLLLQMFVVVAVDVVFDAGVAFFADKGALGIRIPVAARL